MNQYLMAKRKAKRAKKAKRRVAAKKRGKDQSGLWIPAGLLVGIGVGMYYDMTAVGTLIGLGAGFVLMAIHRMLKK